MNWNLHPGCDENCPGFAIMTNPHENHAWSRPPTDAELYEEHENEAADQMSPDPPTHRTSTLGTATPLTQMSSLVDINGSDVPMDARVPLNDTNKIFKIIYVPDPTRAVGEMQAQHDLAFVKTPISKEEFELIRPLGDCVHRMSNKTSRVTGNTEVVVLMQEWLCVMIRLMRTRDGFNQPLFEVSFVPWSEFFEAMLEPSSTRGFWTLALSADCLIGGIDATLSYMNNEYGVNQTNIKDYENGIKKLQRLVYMWPPPDQMQGIASKLQLVQNLDRIATRMKTIRPITQKLVEGQPLTGNFVIKRTHSDSGQHVLLPGDPNRNWEYLKSNREVPGSFWFGQSMVATLRNIGEWRVIIIDGRIICTFHTKYNELKKTWKGEVVSDFYSLTELREMYKQGTLQSQQKLWNPIEGDFETRESARTEFYDFVKTVYAALYRIESRTINGRPSVSVFCRLDIGLIVDQGNVDYFVNEVERTATASLWSNGLVGSGSSKIGIIGTTFALALHKWLSIMNST